MKEYTIIYKNGNTLRTKANYIAWNGKQWQMATNNGITLLNNEYIETIVESEVM